MNISELFATIEDALNEVQAYNEIAVINYGNIDEQTPKAQAALATLRQRVADLEAQNQAMRGHLQCIIDYAINPESASVNAGYMTDAEKISGMWSQAATAIDTNGT